MGRRGRKRKIRLNIDKDTVKSVIAVLLLLVALVILVSFIFPEYTVNSKIQLFTSNFFGKIPALLLPAIFLMGGLLYTRALKWKFVELRIFVGLIFLLLSFSSFFSAVGLNGGKVGNKISEVLFSAISRPGSIFVFLILLVLSTMVVFDISIQNIVGFFENLQEKFGSDKFDFLSFFRKNKGVGEDGGGEEEVLTGMGRLRNLDEPEEEEEVEQETSYEFIPSVSEPKVDESEIKNIISEDGKPSSGLPYSNKIWKPPPLDLLHDSPTASIDKSSAKRRAEIIVQTLKTFGVEARVKETNVGPSVTQYSLESEIGTRISKVKNLHENLALELASPTGSVRIEAPIPGTSYIGIEVPNEKSTLVYFKDVFTSDPMKGAKSKRQIILGKDVSGVSRTYDIARMPHLLVAGATGSGKSVFLHSLIFSLLFRCSPQECKFIFMDYKRVELTHYEDIPHLLTPVVTDIDKAAMVFRWAVKEMKRRYKLIEQAKARNIKDYNEKSGFQALPYIVIVVDELAEIMNRDQASVEKDIVSLASLARAIGIHLILAVQRPDTSVITGVIKANIPTRVAFKVASQIDSRVILDKPGAEKLLGRGDMLFSPQESEPVRIQGAFVKDNEIGSVVKYLKSTEIKPDYKEEIFEVKNDSLSISAGGGSKDEYFDEAVRICVNANKGSASLLQRRLSVGYARAARILDELAAEGYVGPARGNRARKVLTENIPSDESDILEEESEPESDLF